jgi:uncharacterized phage-associated protein
VASAASAHDIAAELRRRLPGVPKKKLHKLLYYCQGHHAATFDEPLFRESVSAWDMGPVIGQLWRAEHTDDPSPPSAGAVLAEAHLNTVGYVVSRYGSLSGRDLEILSHNEAPWHDANLQRRPGASAKIPLESMRDYFRSTADDDGEDAMPDTDEVTQWLSAVEGPPSDPANPDSAARLRSRLGRA